MKSTISISLSRYDDAFENIQRALIHLPPLKISNNDTVIIKINMCDARMPETGAITHPLLLDAFIRYLRTYYENLRIFVVESDATVVIADKFIRWFGFVPVLQKWDAKFINLSKQKIINRRIDGRYFKKIPIPNFNVAKESSGIGIIFFSGNAFFSSFFSLLINFDNRDFFSSFFTVFFFSSFFSVM